MSPGTPGSTTPGTPGGMTPGQPGQPGPSGTPGTPTAPGATPGAPDAPPKQVLPFEALAAAVYGSKVKNLLTGLQLDDAELKMLVANAQTLGAPGGLIDKWIELPEWREKAIAFFRQAFQQTQTDINDYDEQLGRTTNPWNNTDKVRFLRSAEDMFALTAVELIKEGRPFTETVTTERFWMNPPLMSSYAYMDSAPLNDESRPVVAEQWLARKLGANIAFERTQNLDPATGMPRPITFEQSIDPTPGNPYFFKFYEPVPYKGMNDGCKEPMRRMGPQTLRYLADYIYGGRPGCGSTNSQWSVEDWNAWRWVTIRRPKAGEERTIFWDLPKLRKANELVLATPRVGFMTTPAFFANWPTNASNSYRVTTNQALIVGLGKSFDDSGVTLQITETADVDKHIQPGTPCFGCHVTLDPMRDFFRASYALTYFNQYDPMDLKVVGKFAVDDVPPTMGTGIQAFAQGISTHPRFATSWVQKLCHFANSTACVEDDPEFVKLATNFRKSNYNWKTLTREFFSSPLVTFAVETKTAKTEGVVIGIARRETLCASLGNRLKVPDLCGQLLLPGMVQMQAQAAIRVRARNLALAVPGSGYARGDEAPLMPHDPNLFFFSATENLCALLASQLVGLGPQAIFRPGQTNEAITTLVGTIMGLPPSDPRAMPMGDVLREHYAEAMKTGANVTDALQSTFVLACQSPLGVSVGL
jgi:hypothetical protein